MPRYLMSWIASQRRWMKKYRNKRYAISCRQLGTIETKEGSWRAANDWWRSKQHELDAALARPHPQQHWLDLTSAKIEWAKQNGNAQLIKSLEQTLATVKEYPDENGAMLARSGSEIGNWIWADRLRRVKQATGDNVGRQIDKWLAMKVQFASTGKITPDRADTYRNQLECFRAFVGSSTPVSSLNEELFENWFRCCLERTQEDWSHSYADGVFRMGKRFLKWLYERRLLESLPRNFDCTEFRFKLGAKAIRLFTVEEIKAQIRASEPLGQLELHLLLMANCGMYQIDISELKQSEVNWDEGRIVRKRTKTKDRSNAPVVNYKLWHRTFELLNRWRSEDSEFVLLTRNGTSWVRKELFNGRLRKCDSVASNYRRLVPITGISKQMKLIRKTSASILEDHPVYGRYKDVFLAHAPKSMADRHYTPPSQKLFDEAVVWLGQQYGFAGS